MGQNRNCPGSLYMRYCTANKGFVSWPGIIAWSRGPWAAPNEKLSIVNISLYLILTNVYLDYGPRFRLAVTVRRYFHRRIDQNVHVDGMVFLDYFLPVELTLRFIDGPARW